ncbi:hypothetical protein GDO78_006205 [Eleutherodactylus coqui]|uniref:Uncharacterized protein n=1 Tax=Eleutherodactylus coqui TaxID=57060 RepID=A0A8J6FMV7_ELECQ|nr:hypothetical protein GDO78_006205 [Eleutherodactylus coqui]
MQSDRVHMQIYSQLCEFCHTLRDIRELGICHEMHVEKPWCVSICTVHCILFSCRSFFSPSLISSLLMGPAAFSFFHSKFLIHQHPLHRNCEDFYTK